ncbi:MAG: carboxypeptidase-like regulatory domain-containing protein [Fibrobacterota bacterium]|nr:carboxypeptidase-like regulatory domain-containing protein [Fibrobacterota bacterium]
MLPRILTLAAILVYCSLPAIALDISGSVIDKIGDPVPQAKVCAIADPGKCVNTDAQGEFHLTSGIAVRKSAPRSAPYIMDYRRGTLTLEAPAPTKARLEWTGPGGRVLFAATDLSLSRGLNVLSIPAGLPENGICFIRLRAGETNLAWRAMLMGARAKVTAGAQFLSPSPILALSKASALTTLEVSKTGYRTRLYDPQNDSEQDAVIQLAKSDDVGLTFGGDFTAKVIAIDRAKKSLIVETVEAECDGPALIKDTLQDTSLYAFRDGKLWLWTVGECTAQVFSGKGTDPVGTWTLTEPAANLPPELRIGCDSNSTPSDVPYENFTATYVISETQIKGNISLELCPGDIYGLFVAILLSEDTSIALAKNTCKAVQYRNGKDETADLNFTKQGDSLHMEFAYKTTTCMLNQDMSQSDKDPVCPDNVGLETFMGCLVESGFAELGEAVMPPVPKYSAASPMPMSMERPSGVFGAGIQSAYPSLRKKSPSAKLPQDRAGLRESIFPRHGWRFGSSR